MPSAIPMEFPKRERALLQGSPRRSPKATRPRADTEGDENAIPKHLVPAEAASPQRKKVLRERNDGGVGGMEGAGSQPVQQPKPALSPPTLAGRGAGPYDPKTNYTTPRPAFLRYDPERRREMLLRVARAAEVVCDDCSSATSGTAASEEEGGSLALDAAAASPNSSARSSDSEAEVDDGEEEELPARRGRCARRLFLLLVAVACSSCYIYCMNPATFPAYSEDTLGFVGGIWDMYDAVDNELDSLRLLGPVYMMGPEDVLEEITNQIVHEDTKTVNHHLYEKRATPRNLVAVTMMGLPNICLNVSLGELTCQIGSERSENVPDLKEDSEMDRLDTEVAMSFQNGKQSSEVDCLGGNLSLNSICSTSTHIDGMEEGSLESVHLEKREDHSNQSVLQLVFMEKAIKSVSDKMDRKGLESVHLEEWEDHLNQCVLQSISREKAIQSASDKMKDRMGLESEELNSWQYENTAEAAKAICSTVKFLWYAMEPHLLQILACLSFAGSVAALYSYYQRSRDFCTCVTTHDPLAEESLLVPHQAVQLLMASSPQAVRLPVHSSEQPMQLTIPNQDLPGRLEVPMELTLPKLDPLVSLKDSVQESLPKTDPLVTLKVPVIGRGIHDQKLQQGDPDNMKASNGRFLNHGDVNCSKPPVVELLGEFVFANSSRGRSIKDLNQNAEGPAVQDLLKHLGKDEDVDSMQMHSSIIQSPSVRRARKEQEKSVKGEMDATKVPLTPTPLRRSSRLRDKVNSP